MNKAIDEILYEYPRLEKEILERNRELTEFIKSKNEEYGSLGNGAVKSIPEGNGEEHNPLLQVILRFDKHVQYLSDKVRELIEQKEYTEKLLDRLDATEKRIVELRYFQRNGWYRVSIKALYNESWCREINRRLLNKLKWWDSQTNIKDQFNINTSGN